MTDTQKYVDVPLIDSAEMVKSAETREKMYWMLYTFHTGYLYEALDDARSHLRGRGTAENAMVEAAFNCFEAVMDLLNGMVETGVVTDD